MVKIPNVVQLSFGDFSVIAVFIQDLVNSLGFALSDDGYDFGHRNSDSLSAYGTSVLMLCIFILPMGTSVTRRVHGRISHLLRDIDMKEMMRMHIE